MMKTRIIILAMLSLWLMCSSIAFADGIVMTVNGPDGIEQISVNNKDSRVYTVKKGGEYTFTQSDPNTQVIFRISASAPEEDITIRLNGVNFKADSQYSDNSALSTESGKIIRIVLQENTVNRLLGTSGGISIGNGADVIIEGKGTLYATGGSSYRFNGYNHVSRYFAGIRKVSSDNVLTINDGTIYAKGANNAAGIGGGLMISHGAYGGTSSYFGTGTKNIVINGGTIRAEGQVGWSAGIGGGTYANAENITITGGSIYAKGNHGIGSGYNAPASKNIVIAPAKRTTVSAKAGNSSKYAWEKEFTEKTDITSDVKGYSVFEVTSIISPCPHDTQTEVRGAIDPTYEEDGYTGDTYCLECGDMIANGQYIPKLMKPEDMSPHLQSASDALPQTGDNSQVFLWLALLAATSTACLILKRKTA